MKLAVIETGTPADTLRAVHGGYFDMFRDAFTRGRSDISLENFPVYQGAGLPDMRAFDGALITGSPFGVYEDHEFITPLMDFIRTHIDAGPAIAGICFGHQIMAKAMGAVVEKSDKGWGVGVHRYSLTETDALYGHDRGAAMPSLSCVLSHQDQVISIPPSAKCVGGSPFCPNGILRYGNGAGLSFQMHPEFTHSFAKALLDTRRHMIGSEVVALAEKSFSRQSDRLAMVAILIRFFENNRAQRLDRSCEKILPEEVCNV